MIVRHTEPLAVTGADVNIHRTEVAVLLVTYGRTFLTVAASAVTGQTK